MSRKTAPSVLIETGRMPILLLLLERSVLPLIAQSRSGRSVHSNQPVQSLGWWKECDDTRQGWEREITRTTIC